MKNTNRESETYWRIRLGEIGVEPSHYLAWWYETDYCSDSNLFSQNTNYDPWALS